MPYDVNCDKYVKGTDHLNYFVNEAMKLLVRSFIATSV